MTMSITAIVLICLPFAAVLIILISQLEWHLGGSGSFSGNLLLLMFAGIIYILYLDDVMTADRGREIVRQQLHIPADVQIERLNRGQKISVCHKRGAIYRARVRFTPEQYEQYLAAITDWDTWHPEVPVHYNAEQSSFSFSSDALQWRKLPAPRYYGKQQLVWRIAGNDIRRGLAFCYDVNQQAGNPPPTMQDRTLVYSVVPCDARTRKKVPSGGGRLKAALDSDKQQLYVGIQLDSKPAYCKNRVTKWVGERLALDTN